MKKVLMLVISLMCVLSPMMVVAGEKEDLQIQVLQEKEKSLNMEFNWMQERVKSIQREFQEVDQQLKGMVEKRDAEVKKAAESKK
jgi:hypothetical protein